MKTPKLKVLGWRCLIEISNPNVSAGGIDLPEMSKPDMRKGTVVGLGDGRVNDTDKILPFPVKLGDVVLLGPYAVTEYQEDGNLYVITSAQDLLGILND